MSPVFLITCDTIHAAMAAEKAIAVREPKVTLAVIPTPRDITASCGMALRFSASDLPEATLLARSVAEARGLCDLYEVIEEHTCYRLACRL